MLSKIPEWLKGPPPVKQATAQEVPRDPDRWMEELSELLCNGDHSDPQTIERIALLLGQTEEWKDPR